MKKKFSFPVWVSAVIGAVALFCASLPAVAQADDGLKLCHNGALTTQAQVEQCSDWYIDDMGVRDAWADGVTGQDVKVAVIDNQVISDYPALADADISYHLSGDRFHLNKSAGTDENCYSKSGQLLMGPSKVTAKAGENLDDEGQGTVITHGTMMAAYIVGNGEGYDGNRGIAGVAPQASVDHYASWPSSLSEISVGLTEYCYVDGAPDTEYDIDYGAIIASQPKIINMSYNSAISDSDVKDFVDALRHGIIMVSGRANDTTRGSLDLVGNPFSNNYFPGVVTVNEVNSSGEIAAVSNVDDGNVVILSPGDEVLDNSNSATDATFNAVGSGGTSTATAILSGYLALACQKWPNATGNQILQSLVRNTKDNDTGEAVLDETHYRGFGEVDLTKLLSVDPTQYPDINPILEQQVLRSEKHEETKGMYQKDDSLQAYQNKEIDNFGGDSILVSPSAYLIGEEYQRQVNAWKKVEQCQADGGENCMQYSATATADKTSQTTSSTWINDIRSQGLPLRIWIALGIVCAGLIAGLVTVIVICVSKRRRSRIASEARRPLPR